MKLNLNLGDAAAAVGLLMLGVGVAGVFGVFAALIVVGALLLAAAVVGVL